MEKNIYSILSYLWPVTEVGKINLSGKIKNKLYIIYLEQIKSIILIVCVTIYSRRLDIINMEVMIHFITCDTMVINMDDARKVQRTGRLSENWFNLLVIICLQHQGRLQPVVFVVAEYIHSPSYCTV